MEWPGFDFPFVKFRSALTGLALSISGAAAYAAEPVSDSKVPEVRTNGGLRFQSEGAGTPNTLSGYIFAPLSQSEKGNTSCSKAPRDLIKATFGEPFKGAPTTGIFAITTGTFTITNNTVTSAPGAGDAFDYESLGTSSSNSFKFKIEGNNFSAADDNDLKIAIPAGFLGIFAPDGTSNFEAYLNGINTNADTEIIGSPEVFRF